ncbi:protein OBERON 3-like isoform X2 [Mangifera indica]|uniref:protein OBERON 3-like isoform X2 n=1 Tax=Mangifera indica TaxID=29780 RepID=UPI001CF98334|nr:protein OBERON 3-like isoform X2 [Mangifera indica]
MFGEKDLSADLLIDGENSVSNKLSHGRSILLEQSKGIPHEKIGLTQKGGHDFFKESNINVDGFSSKLSNSASQELTLRYLCENSKLGEKLLMEKSGSHKGKEVVFVENSNQDDKFVERDFLNLNEIRVNFSCSKREIEEEEEDLEGESNTNNREKKPNLETLNLSLSLPDVSLSLTASNALQKPARSLQSLAPSRDNHTQTTCSNDITAASLSHSCSHPFSHNPSCSLTHNSTENYEYSVGRDDQIWCGGEGTNGSVHSRFKPIGDGLVTLNNHGGGGGGGGFSMMQGSRLMNRDSCNNSLYKTTSSDNLSFFPSELPARPWMDTNSGDSRRKDSENLRGLDNTDGGKARKVSRPERILWEIVSESIPVMAQIIQELSEETLELIRGYLKNLFVAPEKKDALVGLQKQLERRPDLNKETLSNCCKDQLEILVAVKVGLGSFVSSEVQLPINELVEIFLLMRCRNVNCKSILPVDDCDCKICSTNKGFCSSCMCPVCMNFDCANNTCSWVGCDVCSHWCHAACGIKRNLFRPGPSLKGPSGTSEMQFHCIGCDHASEMFGFVKDVFLFCAKDWGLDTLVKELDCVGKIFKGSDDFKGKELHIKANKFVSKLENKMMSPSDVCSSIVQFFNHYAAAAASSTLNDLMAAQASLRKDRTPIPPATSLPPKYTMHNITSSSGRRDSNGLCQKDLMSDLKIEDDFQFGKLSKNDGFDSLESIVRIKEVEARMFQNKADDARREAEEYKRMIQIKSEKLDKEYAQKLAKLCLQETEERQRKKLDELKVLEDSHCDYFKMKMRMQVEISGLLERMEATKQQWV